MFQDMTNLTFNRILHTVSIVTIFVSALLLLIMLYSGNGDERADVNGKGPDIKEICALPDGVPPFEWRMILIHHSGRTGDNLEAVRAYYMNSGSPMPYHFIICRDGRIMPRSPWKKQEWCAQTEDDDYNQQSIGICVIGNFSLPGSVPTPEQMASLTKLVRYLMSAYRIPFRYVWQRSEMTDQKDSPGKNFPWKEFQKTLN